MKESHLHNASVNNDCEKVSLFFVDRGYASSTSGSTNNAHVKDDLYLSIVCVEQLPTVITEVGTKSNNTITLVNVVDEDSVSDTASDINIHSDTPSFSTLSRTIPQPNVLPAG